jgi:hypothetical protein
MKVISLLRLDGALILESPVNPPILDGAEIAFWVSQSGKPRKVARIGLPNPFFDYRGAHRCRIREIFTFPESPDFSL